MTAIEPQVSDTGRYSIKETCEHLKINRGTLSAHTKAGYIRCGFRQCPAYRRIWRERL